MFIFPSYPHPYFVKESEKSERKIKRKGEQKKREEKVQRGCVADRVTAISYLLSPIRGKFFQTEVHPQFHSI